MKKKQILWVVSILFLLSMVSIEFVTADTYPLCYMSAQNPCSSLTTSGDCWANSLCQWVIGVPPWSYDSCILFPQNECAASTNGVDCVTKPYCSWNTPECKINTTYCEIYNNNQVMCTLPGGLCIWQNPYCIYNTSVTDNSCAPNSWPKWTNTMCNSLFGLCEWYTPELCNTNFRVDPGEECDPTINGTSVCNSDCTINPLYYTFCGDGAVQWPNVQGNYETCDGSNLNYTDCQTLGFLRGILNCFNPTLSNKCTFNVSGCTNAVCGDNFCDPGETTVSCFRDCEPVGWHTDDDGWSITANDRLTFSLFNGVIYSDLFDLHVGSMYTLSAAINTQYCSDVLLDFDAANCTDGITGETYSGCFANQQITNMEGQKTFTVIDINNHASNNYLKNVRLRIRAIDCDTSGYPTIDNVALVEVPVAHIDFTPNIDAVSACCPAQWCFNGAVCVDSSLWMSDSLYAPIWNNIFFPDDRWREGHVNSTSQANAIGYRCINSSGTAVWTPSTIKYDWNFKNSGYCNLPTDCFVTDTNFGAGRAGCIHSGEFMDDAFTNAFIVGGSYVTGDHYCDNGTWSTKTALMADFLTSAAFYETKPFILSCDVYNNTYNLHGLFDVTTNPPASYTDAYYTTGLRSACTIIIKTSNSEEQIITAVYVEGTENDFLTTLLNQYNLLGFDGNIPTVPGSLTDAHCINTASPDVLLCVGFEGTGGPPGNPATHLRVYYNTTGRYFLISDKNINYVNPTFGYRIRDFFRRIFGINQGSTIGFINQTTNFNNIFLIENNTLKVLGVQEQKYDELTYLTKHYIYLNYTDTTISTRNTLDTGYIGNTTGVLSINVNNLYCAPGNIDCNAQEIIIISDRKIILWPYLTGMLRDRNTAVIN